MIGNWRPHPLIPSPKERGRNVKELKARAHTNNTIQERGWRDERGKTSPPAPPLGKGRGARTGRVIVSFIIYIYNSILLCEWTKRGGVLFKLFALLFP